MKRKRTKQFRQGIFTCRNKDKYKGTHPIIYRSSYEAKFMYWADCNPNVLSWGSESVIVPYPNPLTKKTSRYFVDFNLVLRDPKTNQTKTFLVEIKPHSQTLPPTQQTKNTKALQRRQAEYAKNQAKWQAATAYANSKGQTFTVITEKQLFPQKH